MVSSNASLSYSEIASARTSPSQPLFFQLYKHKDNAVAEKRVREVEALGYNAIFLTVDAPYSANRERDVRAGWAVEDMAKIRKESAAKASNSANEMPRKQSDLENIEEEADVSGTAGALIVNDDVDMTWKEVRIIPHGYS